MIQMPRLVSLILMATLIVVLGLMFYQVVAPFLMPLFLAGVLAILCQPIHRYCLRRTKNRPAIAAALTTAVVLAAILTPLVIGTISAARQMDKVAKARLEGHGWRNIFEAAKNSKWVREMVTRYGQLTGDPVEIDEIEQEVDARFREVAKLLAAKTLGSAGATLSLLGGAITLLVSSMTFVIALYYFLADGPGLIDATVNLIPVNPDYQRQLITQFDNAVRAVVSATFAAAIGQGIATGIGMEIADKWRGAQMEAWLAQGIPVPYELPLAGISYFFIATILATLTALVPLLGTWLVWGPYALWLWYTGHWLPAAFVTLYGLVVVGLLDNVIRTYILHSNVKLHPLLAFVSVLGGVQALGLWGVFVGPIVASCLHALVKIFNTELVAFSQERRTRQPSSPDAATVLMTAADLKRTEQPPKESAPKRPAAAESQVSMTSPVMPPVTGSPPAVSSLEPDRPVGKRATKS